MITALTTGCAAHLVFLILACLLVPHGPRSTLKKTRGRVWTNPSDARFKFQYSTAPSRLVSSSCFRTASWPLSSVLQGPCIFPQESVTHIHTRCPAETQRQTVIETARCYT
ncbi:hypothetical protein DENSPDRAFT_218257 [Dentipellis sp. KUC8613]|nr:hypothetical protein DENSPDRAFT_218257 [Dentipellis sp. KUC8613]